MLIEIMTGSLQENIETEINNAFSLDRMSFAIKRSGIFPSQQVSKVVSELKNKSSVIVSNYFIGKLLITARHPEKSKTTPCHILTPNSIDEFITKCYAQYAIASGSRHIEFADELMQYFTWRSNNLMD